MIRFLTLLVVASFLGCISGPRPIIVAEGDTVKIPGTYLSGSNLTEPRPTESAMLRLVSAGTVVLENGAGLYAVLEFKAPRTREYYVRSTWPDPLDPEQPIVNGAVVPIELSEFGLSSPRVISGLEIYKNYKIEIAVFESEDAIEPVDVLEQKLRSYVDTHGIPTMIHGRLRPR